MNKCYYRIVWENYPSDRTPLNEQNLNKIDVATDEMDNRIISLDSTKFDKTEAQMLVKYIEYDENTGIFKIIHYNGASYTIDTLLEKLAINFDYDYQTQRLIIELSDGTVKYVDLSALITQYEFLNSDTVHFTIIGDGKVKAEVKEGSIQEKHLRPDYLADIKVEVAKAEASAAEADASKTNAAASATTASTKAGEAVNSAANAAESAATATEKATAAGNSATNAASSAASASNSAMTATDKADDAATSAENAADSASTASAKANTASASATAAAGSATSADTYAKKSQSYAVGGTGTRPGEDTDNAKKYYEQAKAISESFSGGLRPIGTVTFANLPALANAVEGDMYNVSDQFTTNENFKEGAGLTIPAGSNVYKTADAKWDVLAGSPVTGVKGNKETSYRKGNVNLTPENIGAVAKSGDEMSGNLSFLNGNGIIQNQASTSNSTKVITWLKGGVSQGLKNDPCISQHNTGGTEGSGSITILPYATDNNTYEGKVGLFLEKGKAKIDGKKIITESDDLESNPVDFTSSDTSEPTGWINWTIFTAKMKLSQIMYRVSVMANNIRWLYKKLGTTDISVIGGGTVTGAISKLNTDLGSKQATINGGASTITSSNLTANRALVSNASGKVAVSAVTATELGYLDGVTGNVQTQLNKKSNGLYVKAITFTAITINAGTYGYHKANATWSGYTPIGIIGVLLNEAAEISLHDFHVSGHEAILGYRNDGTTNLTLRSLIANVLYIKQ